MKCKAHFIGLMQTLSIFYRVYIYIYMYKKHWVHLCVQLQLKWKNKYINKKANIHWWQKAP